MFYWIKAEKLVEKFFIFLSFLFLLYIFLEISFFTFYFINFFIFEFILSCDKVIKFIILVSSYIVTILFLFEIIFNIILKANIDNTPIYDFYTYRLKQHGKNKIIIFHPEEIKLEDKKNILLFLKLLDIYSFASRKYLVKFVYQITVLNIVIFLFSFLMFSFKNEYDYIYHFIWIIIASITYIFYFVYWINLFSYEKMNKIYKKLILKSSFKKNLTFYIVPLRKALSLSEVFKYSFSERERNFEKYINLMIQILLPISYIAFLTFYIGFKAKG